MLLALKVMLLDAEVMLLAAEVMLLHAEVMLLHVGDFVGEHKKKRGDTWCAAPALRVI